MATAAPVTTPWYAGTWPVSAVCRGGQWLIANIGSPTLDGALTGPADPAQPRAWELHLLDEGRRQCEFGGAVLYGGAAGTIGGR